MAAARLELSQAPWVHGAKGSLLGARSHLTELLQPQHPAPAPLAEWARASLRRLAPALDQPHTTVVGTFIVGRPTRPQSCCLYCHRRVKAQEEKAGLQQLFGFSSLDRP